jgi:deoxyribonuclease-4
MSTKKRRLLLGAHMSIAGGLEQAIISGSSIGCTTIQLFTKSNRQWNAKPLTDDQIELFKKTHKEYAVDPVVAHATYLINIASPDSKIVHASMKALAFELERCQSIEVPYLVLHPGSYTSGDRQEGLDRISKHLDEIFEQVPGSTMILLETMAGQGSVLCSTFEDIATVINNSKHKNRLGVCVDTCHLFVAGYDLRNPEAYKKTWDDFDQIIGLDRLKVIHINDSKKGLHSRVDRHEHIGKGELGLEPFRLLFNDERFFDVPKILETPKSTEEPFTEDKINMAIIRSVMSEKTKKSLNIKD